jgi:hypothetical protein
MPGIPAGHFCVCTYGVYPLLEGAGFSPYILAQKMMTAPEGLMNLPLQVWLLGTWVARS